MKEQIVNKLTEQAIWYWEAKTLTEEDAKEAKYKFNGMVEIARLAGITNEEIAEIARKARENA